MKNIILDVLYNLFLQLSKNNLHVFNIMHFLKEYDKIFTSCATMFV